MTEKYSDLQAKIGQLNSVGADLYISRRNGYYAIENQAQSYVYCTGSKAELAKWLHGYATALYRTDSR